MHFSLSPALKYPSVNFAASVKFSLKKKYDGADQLRNKTHRHIKKQEKNNTHTDIKLKPHVQTVTECRSSFISFFTLNCEKAQTR